MSAQLQAPAIGYRAFRWAGDGPLRSTGVEAVWPITREPQQARCLCTSAPQHDAPQEDCTCGIYAHSTPDDVGVTGVGAVVMGYGNLIIHPDGWRAATVELVALVWQPRINPMGFLDPYMPNPVPREGLDLLAEQYGVRVLDRWEDAAALAREHGAEPIPEILHAEAEAWWMVQPKGVPLVGFFMPSAMGLTREALESGLVIGWSITYGGAPLPTPSPTPSPPPPPRPSRFDTPRQRHARWQSELARRTRGRGF